jgi:hypothetical protein
MCVVPVRWIHAKLFLATRAWWVKPHLFGHNPRLELYITSVLFG